MRNLNKILLAATLLGALVSCNEDDDVTEERIVKPIVTVDQTNFTVNEGETVTVTMTTNTPINQRSDFKLELVGGDGTFRDYVVEGDNNPDTDDETTIDDGYGVIGHKITLPAYATSSTFDITPVVDYYADDNEVLEFRLYPMANSNTLVDTNSEFITITVGNTINDNLEIEFNWAQTTNAHGNYVDREYIGADGGSHSYTEWDFDIIVFDPSFNPIYDGATSASPEYVGISSTDADGDYYVLIDLYYSSQVDDTDYVADRPFSFPAELTVSKFGVWNYTFDLSSYWTSDDLGSDAGDDDSLLVAVINKSGTTYTLTDYDSGDELATGRMQNNILQTIKEKLANRRK